MTPQESAMLNDLARKIEQTQLVEKDAEAESFLRDRLGSNPDALYILTQTVLVQNIALDRAQAQIRQLQEQVQQAQSQTAHSTSFLGSLLGRRDSPPPAQPAAIPQPLPQYYPSAPAYAPNYAASPISAPPPSGGGSSFLRSAATTAAGVAAGALAFEGVESLLHGFGHGGGFGESGFGGGGFGGGGFGERPVEETVINNYYDDPSQALGERHEREASFDERPGAYGSGEGGQLHDASYDASGDLDRAQSSGDLQGFDTLDDDQTSGGIDDSGFDDSSSLDGGGDDSNVI